jgi:hypothetical protein
MKISIRTVRGSTAESRSQSASEALQLTSDRADSLPSEAMRPTPRRVWFLVCIPLPNDGYYRTLLPSFFHLCHRSRHITGCHTVVFLSTIIYHYILQLPTSCLLPKNIIWIRLSQTWLPRDFPSSFSGRRLPTCQLIRTPQLVFCDPPASIYW